MYKLILVDLDGTLLNDKRDVSDRTVRAIEQCRRRGMLLGFATARNELTAGRLLKQLKPDIAVLNGGALVMQGDKIIRSERFTDDETERIIKEGLALGREVIVDTIDGSYWNYSTDPCVGFPDWAGIKRTDYSIYSMPHGRALDLCIMLEDEAEAKRIAGLVKDCVCVRISGFGFKFSLSNSVKDAALDAVEQALSISAEEIVAFGDDYSDIELLRRCGLGIAMGNAVPEVKLAADYVTEDNAHDGVAAYLEKEFLEGCRYDKID